jgi:hypothetical protein
LIGIAVAVVLIAAFLSRGHRGGQMAWEQCQRDLEGKGEKLDWKAFIPAPVSDDQNFYKAPGMMEQFSRQASRTNQVTIFELPPWATKQPLTLDDLRALPEKDDSAPDGQAAVVCSRARLRDWFARHDTEYRLLEQASSRPAARFEADYRDPMAMDIPNFINQRKVVQALASRASLNVLDGKPDAAVLDLFLMRRVADMAGGSPTLVGAMIRVAILGLYLPTARDAMESGILSEAQLKAIQEHLRNVNLLDDLTRSVRAERAMQVHLLSLSPAELIKLLEPQLQPGSAKTQLSAAFWRFDWQKWFSDFRLKFHLRSRDWRALNMASLGRFHQEIVDAVDVPNQRVHAAALDKVFVRAQQTLGGASSSQLAAFLMPNFSRAFLTTARNQTQLNQFRAACALERFRLVNGKFPDHINALVPDYLDVIPNDLFSEKPLQYRRDEHGGYLLWSVGWNEQDHSGVFTPDVNGKPMQDDKKGDWIWLRASK